jgi:hypothetical protein
LLDKRTCEEELVARWREVADLMQELAAIPDLPFVWLAVALLIFLGVTACLRQCHYLRHGFTFIFPPDRWATHAWRVVGRLIICCARALRAYWTTTGGRGTTRDVEMQEMGEATQVRLTMYIAESCMPLLSYLCHHRCHHEGFLSLGIL